MATLTPAYGRDYTSKKAALADWEADKVFILNDMFSQWDGKPVNRSQMPTGRHTIRYKKLTQVCTVTK